jgi:hypothetical protein
LLLTLFYQLCNTPANMMGSQWETGESPYQLRGEMIKKILHCESIFVELGFSAVVFASLYATNIISF